MAETKNQIPAKRTHVSDLPKSDAVSNATRVSHLPKAPTLKRGDDAKVAAELEQYIDDAESGLRSIFKAGFFLECIAADLPQSQLGPWVNAHCKRSWRTVQRWQEVAKLLGEKLGISYKKRLELKLHEVLSLPIAKVPEPLKKLREEIDAEITGKSYRQIFWELKQCEEDEEGNAKVKRGRLKGQGGVSKEQRQAAKEREERERIEDMELAMQDAAKFIIDHSDDKGFGSSNNEKLIAKFKEAMQTGVGYLNRLEQRRKGQ